MVKLLLGLSAVFLSWVVHATTIDGFDFANERAIFSFGPVYEGKKIRDYQILDVSFANKSTYSVARGKRLESIGANLIKDKMLFRREGVFYFYDLEDHSTLYKYKATSAKLVFLSKVNLIAGINNETHKIVIIDPIQKVVQEYDHNGEYLWGIDWNATCECVEFELSNPESREHYVVRAMGDKLVKAKDTLYLKNDEGGSTRAYFSYAKYDEAPVDFIIETAKKGVTYSSRGPVLRNHMLWSENTLRLLRTTALLDLTTLKLIYPTSDLWQGEMPRFSTGIVDMASDPNGYVLRWHKEKQLFEVEDIRTGKTVKTYKKFW